jgi:hypothetical protein
MLGVAFEVFSFDIQDAPLVNVARGHQPLLDQLPQPNSGLGVKLVVVGLWHLPLLLGVIELRPRGQLELIEPLPSGADHPTLTPGDMLAIMPFPAEADETLAGHQANLPWLAHFLSSKAARLLALP